MRKAERNGWRIKEKNALARIVKKKSFVKVLITLVQAIHAE